MKSVQAMMENEKVELQTKNGELESEKTDLASKNTELESEKTDLASNNTELESENADLASKNADLETEKAELISGKLNLETELAKLGSEKVKLESELEKFQVVPMNHWNSAECHPDLSLVVERREDNGGLAFVCAELMVPRHCQQGISYFEVTIEKICRHVMVGLAPQSLKTTTNAKLKNFSGCYFYDSFGEFVGHNVGGCKYDCNVMPYIDGKPGFFAGDVIGCGVNLTTRQIIYTKNGKHLDTYNLFVSKTLDLYPFVALLDIGDKVEANFGQR